MERKNFSFAPRLAAVARDGEKGKEDIAEEKKVKDKKKGN